MTTILCGLIRGWRSPPAAFTPTYDSFSCVGFTKPLVQVFNSSEETFSWDVKDKTSQLFSEDLSALARGYARWSVFGDLALQRTRISAEHASTAMVARDMLYITRAFGFDKLNYWGPQGCRGSKCPPPCGRRRSVRRRGRRSPSPTSGYEGRRPGVCLRSPPINVPNPMLVASCAQRITWQV
jgi:hypothetical protein